MKNSISNLIKNRIEALEYYYDCEDICEELWLMLEEVKKIEANSVDSILDEMPDDIEIEKQDGEYLAQYYGGDEFDVRIHPFVGEGKTLKEALLKLRDKLNAN